MVVAFEQWLSKFDNTLRDFNKSLSKVDGQTIDLNSVDLNDYESVLKYSLQGESVEDYYALCNSVYIALEEILRTYLNASPKQMRRIENLFLNRRSINGFLIAYPGYVNKFIVSSNDAHWVRLGAAAAVIEGGRTDFRDLWLSLGALYIQSIKHEIDPVNIFLEVEALTLRVDTGFFNSMNFGKGILSDFLNSEYLASIT